MRAAFGAIDAVRIVAALRSGELCVCQITEVVSLAPSTVSKHMSILRQAGLVDSRKEGRWIYYRLPDKEAPRVIRDALAWVAKSLTGDRRIKEDAKRLTSILKIDPEQLCKTQSQR